MESFDLGVGGQHVFRMVFLGCMLLLVSTFSHLCYNHFPSLYSIIFGVALLLLPLLLTSCVSRYFVAHSQVVGVMKARRLLSRSWSICIHLFESNVIDQNLWIFSVLKTLGFDLIQGVCAHGLYMVCIIQVLWILFGGAFVPLLLETFEQLQDGEEIWILGIPRHVCKPQASNWELYFASAILTPNDSLFPFCFVFSRG